MSRGKSLDRSAKNGENYMSLKDINSRGGLDDVGTAFPAFLLLCWQHCGASAGFGDLVSPKLRAKGLDY